MVAEAELAGLGLEVVRAALDSERHKHATENAALRRAARAWKTRAQTLESRLRELRAENESMAMARKEAEEALQHVQVERDTLRGFKSRILASISSGNVSLNPSVAEELPEVRPVMKSGASPCGTVVGVTADRRHSLTASDKVRNWEADNAACAEKQELDRKVQMVHGWDPSGSSAAYSGLDVVPLSPVASSGADHGWGKLLDCSAVDSTLSLGGSPSSYAESVGDSGAATRHSTDASGSLAACVPRIQWYTHSCIAYRHGPTARSYSNRYIT